MILMAPFYLILLRLVRKRIAMALGGTVFVDVSAISGTINRPYKINTGDVTMEL